MEISNVLTTLINAGADAPANLYLVNFFENTPADDQLSLSDSLTIRTGNFVIPSIAINTVEFPYLNDVYHKPVPSSNINKMGSFSLRVDKYFKCYNFLKDHVAIDEKGNWLKIKNSIGSFEDLDLKDLLIKKILVSYVRDDDLNTPIKTWEFTDCYILDVGSFSYDYKNSGPLSVPVKFTWGDLTSNPPRKSF